jgi:1-aminocyclopropane-1-carboxylate deaminase
LILLEYNPIINTLQIEADQQLDVLRLDAVHPEISGNKWFKLKYNIAEAKRQNFQTILTFGGAYSNHIAATAAACKQMNLKCIGVIRGEEVLNPTLQKAADQGMQLEFVDRKTYLLKEQAEYQSELQKRFGDFYLIPEGGNNKEGIKGCSEIIKQEWDYDYIFCACGTGATFAGLYLSLKPRQSLIGISVLKGENTLPSDVERSLSQLFGIDTLKIGGNEVLEQIIIDKSCISNLFSFSGYAAYDKELVEFKTEFEKRHGILLDNIYTVKLFYAVARLISANKFKKGSKILVIHSGGLQGNRGFEERYHLKPMR